jgi:Zn finger protein HypA/HybF involved in hydrogenase expression
MNVPAPIEPKEFLHGVKVVTIGDLRVARGRTRRAHSSCRHAQLVYNDTERRIWCEDCQSEVEPFDAFTSIVERHAHLQARIDQFYEAQSHALFSRAAKVMDEAFRSRNYAPCCPHCKQAILPGDVANGVSRTSKELELRRRALR